MVDYVYETVSEDGDKTIHAYDLNGNIYRLTLPNPKKLAELKKGASDESKQEDYGDWLRRQGNRTGLGVLLSRRWNPSGSGAVKFRWKTVYYLRRPYARSGAMKNQTKAALVLGAVVLVVVFFLAPIVPFSCNAVLFSTSGNVSMSCELLGFGEIHQQAYGESGSAWSDSCQIPTNSPFAQCAFLAGVLN